MPPCEVPGLDGADGSEEAGGADAPHAVSIETVRAAVNNPNARLRKSFMIRPPVYFWQLGCVPASIIDPFEKNVNISFFMGLLFTLECDIYKVYGFLSMYEEC